MVRQFISNILYKISNWISPIDGNEAPIFIEIGEAIYPAESYNEVIGAEGMPVGIVFAMGKSVKRAIHCPYIVHINDFDNVAPINEIEKNIVNDIPDGYL